MASGVRPQPRVGCGPQRAGRISNRTNGGMKRDIKANCNRKIRES